MAFAPSNRFSFLTASLSLDCFSFFSSRSSSATSGLSSPGVSFSVSTSESSSLVKLVSVTKSSSESVSELFTLELDISVSEVSIFVTWLSPFEENSLTASCVLISCDTFPRLLAQWSMILCSVDIIVAVVDVDVVSKDSLNFLNFSFSLNFVCSVLSK